MGQIADGLYDSEFPIQPMSGYLTDIAQSVYLISILAFYQSYDFSLTAGVTSLDTRENLLDTAAEGSVFQQPASGTATLIFQDRNRVAFITCAHIVNFPDTLITYHQDENGNDTAYIKSVTVKIRQINNLINQPQVSDFEIVALDEQKDIALIGKELRWDSQLYPVRQIENKLNQPLVVLDTPLGNADELQWGTFVYMIGYPMGKKMMSTAIVSSPDYDGQQSFILDATLKKGVSGGIVLAVRDGAPNLEVVGMAKGISGISEYLLVPDPDLAGIDWKQYEEYDGKIHVKRQDISSPGMTFVIGTEAILEFFEDKKEEFRDRGYSPDLFFKRAVGN
jgi:V8-like Glu-specific endopeptidase